MLFEKGIIFGGAFHCNPELGIAEHAVFPTLEKLLIEIHPGCGQNICYKNQLLKVLNYFFFFFLNFQCTY